MNSIPSILTANRHEAEFPDASVLVTVTIVVCSTGNKSPGPSGEYVTTGSGSALSSTIAAGKLTRDVVESTSSGQISLGA